MKVCDVNAMYHIAHFEPVILHPLHHHSLPNYMTSYMQLILFHRVWGFVVP